MMPLLLLPKHKVYMYKTKTFSFWTDVLVVQRQHWTFQKAHEGTLPRTSHSASDRSAVQHVQLLPPTTRNIVWNLPEQRLECNNAVCVSTTMNMYKCAGNSGPSRHNTKTLPTASVSNTNKSRHRQKHELRRTKFIGQSREHLGTPVRFASTHKELQGLSHANWNA